MEKRLIVAIALSILVLSAWSHLSSKWYPAEKETQLPVQTLESTEPLTKETSFVDDAKEISVVDAAATEEAIAIHALDDKAEFYFDDNQATIIKTVFYNYKSYEFKLGNGLFVRSNLDKKFIKELKDSNTLQYVQSDSNKKIIKEFIYSKDYNYGFMFKLTIVNNSMSNLTIDFPIVLGTLNFKDDPAESRFKDATIRTDERTIHHNAKKSADFDSIDFISFRDRYFCALLQPESDYFRGYINKISKNESEVGVRPVNLFVGPGESKTEQFLVYIGPQDPEILNAFNPLWTSILYHGTFDVISHALLGMLRFLSGVLHNWGLAIIVLSFIVYLILFPLSLKQMRSMKEMQTLQPKVEELRRTYKDNPQKLNKEIMELYREHKVNPLGGCLPLILQIPIFFALYQALIRSISLKGANFLWIQDLSEPDRLFVFPKALPVIGGQEFNLLPILMAIGMFVQQKTTAKQAATGSSEQQRIMAIILPLMFGFIFYRMPSGLVLYWFTNSTLMLVNQIRMSKQT